MRLTRERAKELLPIIQAFTEGKTIQWKDGLGRWLDFSNEDAEVNFNDCPSHYRIKPEPKYRPFRTQEECWQEMHKHPDFGWIVSKEDLGYCYICDIFTLASKKLMITLGIDENYSHEADSYLNNYTFTDGEPFGIKEE